MVAILNQNGHQNTKILRFGRNLVSNINKEHNFEWWSIFVSSFKRIRCTVWIKKKLHLGYYGNDRHFESPKICHTLQWIFLQSLMKFDERNPNKFLIPLFCFHGNCEKVCPWNFAGMLSTMSRCADHFWNFQNDRRCHGNSQNAKKHKNDHSRLLAE
jgi:hypothetical protein